MVPCSQVLVRSPLPATGPSNSWPPSSRHGKYGPLSSQDAPVPPAWTRAPRSVHVSGWGPTGSPQQSSPAVRQWPRLARRFRQGRVADPAAVKSGASYPTATSLELPSSRHQPQDDLPHRNGPLAHTSSASGPGCAQNPFKTSFQPEPLLRDKVVKVTIGVRSEQPRASDCASTRQAPMDVHPFEDATTELSDRGTGHKRAQRKQEKTRSAP